MSQFLTTAEVASLLRIKERKVYDLASKGQIPCSRATGKLLFPKNAIEQWLKRSQALPSAHTPPAVILGSHDPLLEWALRESGCGIASFFDGSFDGLERYKNGEGIATGLHLYDADTQQWNTPCIEKELNDKNIALMQWAKRQRGLIVSQEKSSSVQSIRELKGLRMVPRQATAGSQQLLLSLIRSADLKITDIEFLPPERTETDALLPILQGKADVTLGLSTLAKQHNLPFIALVEERFDIAVDRSFWFEPAWQKLLSFCQEARFKDKALESEGYDITNLGRIHYNAQR
jgi:excisionase family DNA binding protein